MNRFCGQCGGQIKPDGKFCERCGAAVNAVPPAGPAPPAAAAPEIPGRLTQEEATLLREAPAVSAPSAPPPASAASAPAPAPASQIRPPSTGQLVGPYRLIRELGRGGMGLVFLAMRDDGTFRKNVALKVLLQERVNQEFLLRFRQERQVLAALDHPNIARILDGGDTSEGMPYYVMEFVEGSPIEHYCEQPSVSLPDRIRLFQQVLSAVHYLHQHLIVHRDLKPSNIMVSTEGVAKLLDFGIAKFLGPISLASGPDLTTQGQPLTPAYASPEQIAGGTAQKTSDVYSLGVILYRLLTGRTPYQGIEEKLAGMHTRQEPPLPSHNIREDLRNPTETTAKLRRRMIGDLDQIVLMAMRLDPRERYQTAAEFADDLQRFLDGMPVLARKGSFASRSVRLLRRKWVAAAVVIGFVALGGVSGWEWMHIRKQAVEVAAREADMRKLLDSLEARSRVPEALPKQPEGAASSDAATQATLAQLVKDVRQLREALDQQVLQTGKRPGLTPERKALFDRTGRDLNNLRPLASTSPDLGLELAATYQQLGAARENASGSAGAAGSGALDDYKAAAGLLTGAARGNANDPRVGGRLAFLNKRIAQLGGSAIAAPPVQVQAQPPAPAPVAPAPPPRTARAAPNRLEPPAKLKPPPPALPPAQVERPAEPAVSAEELRAVQQQLVIVTAKVNLAEQSIEPIRQSLARNGQMLNADLATSMNRMKAQLEKAKRDVAAGNVAAAQESLRITDGLAAKVLKTVGR